MTPAVAPPAPGLRAAALLAGLAGAVALRLGVAGAQGLGAQPAAPLGAALVFAAALLALSLLSRWRPRWPSRRGLLAGAGGGAVLLAVPVALRLGAVHAGGGGRLTGFAAWGLCVVAVAVAEEVLLRGVLFDAVDARGGAVAAVAVAAAAFALLHVPLYGWTAVPLDLAAGVWLGGLRLAGRGVAAPAVAHSAADLGAWWLL